MVGVGGGDVAERIDDLVVEAVGDREEQLLLAGEVLVDRAPGEAGRRRDLLEGGAFVAALGEHLGGRRDQDVTGLLPTSLPGQLLHRHGLMYTPLTLRYSDVSSMH